MVTFTLILFFHVGAMGGESGNSTATVPNFVSEQECIAAGEKSQKLVDLTVKKLRYVCVKQTKAAM